MAFNLNSYLFLADIAGSSDLEPGAGSMMMQSLIQTLDMVNTKYKSSLIAPFEINYGDEFAALFSELAPIQTVIHLVRDSLKEFTSFRCVIAKGRVNNPEGSVRQMGGPVFKSASALLDALKTSNRFSAWRVSDQLTDATLEALTNLPNALIQEMTEYQYDVFILLMNGLPQIEIAKQLDKYPQSVSRAIQQSHADQIIDAEITLNNYLAVLDKQEVGI